MMLAGLGLALVLWLVAWRAWRLCLEHAGASWTSPWCASEGGDADRDPPRGPELTIKEIWALRPEITLWVLRRGVPERDAEDVVQTVIEAAWNARRRWDPRGGALSTWLFIVTRNQVHSYLGRAQIRHETPTADPLAGVASPDDPEAAAELRQSGARALEILDRLPSHLAVLFAHHEVDGEGMKEIAAELGIPISTAWSQIQQARAAVAVELAREAARQRWRKAARHSSG